MIRVMKPLEKLLFMAVIFAAGLALALHFSGKSLTDVALGAKPPSPPGQGECAHGNSNKPCKDDPQPEHGQDCDEHGPKNGGVNEDHCKGTPTDTTPTETTPTETTPTTEEPPTCNDCPLPTVPQTTPDTPPDAGSSTPPAPTSSPSTPDASAPGVSKTTLEKQLDKQASENGAGAAPSTHAPGTATASELPYTGFPLWAIALIGAGLVGGGLALRRR